MTRRAWALATAAAVAAGCGGAYLTAPPGSTIVVVANPDRIASHGGVSELMAIVTEPIGTDVPDGTVVFWSTTLGHVDRETRTEHGIARNRLVSDSRSGQAHVVATSGGEATPTTPSSPGGPGPGNPPTTTTTTLLGPGSKTASAGFFSAAAQNSAFVDVIIGNALVAFVRLRANPQRITNSNTTHVIATVTDINGNPIPNVPVFFEVISNKDTDFFESAGAAVFTNNNGEAEDLLRTRRTTVGTITVRASAAGPGQFIPSPDFLIEVQ
jgi:hypothetical protein